MCGVVFMCESLCVAQAVEYFREEYYLSHLISSYTKPVRMLFSAFL